MNRRPDHDRRLRLGRNLLALPVILAIVALLIVFVQT